ncbi:MAG: cardiolipin synthase [Reyranellaceae bacterium]
MLDLLGHSLIALLAHTLLVLGVIARILLRPNRDPASRIAWIVVVATLPLVGIITYLLFGETNIGQRRAARLKAALAHLPATDGPCFRAAESAEAAIPERYRHVFRLGRSISGFDPVGGNKAELMVDSNTAIDTMVADIDSATDHVHLLFYIWLPDNNGCKIVEALKRAAARGIVCRAMADDLGSRAMIRSPHWQAMRAGGVRVASGLPVGNLLLRPFVGRIDLRNHRKIVVIDDRITYCGSQNCADPEFLVKAKFAPWVDAVMRFEGPIARQNQYLFASDWMTYVPEDNIDCFKRPLPPHGAAGVPAQVIGTGPTVRHSAMPEMFEALMFAARQELVVSTPYFVPNEALLNALCTTSWRGVDTTIIFPARNDSWIVAAASRSYYAELLAAGVKIYEYEGGLLHTKSLTVDRELTLIGSANMDRRSFDLNYENNIVFYDRGLTCDVWQRQQDYLAMSRRVTEEKMQAWPAWRRLWNNSIAMMGPLL